MSQGRILFIDAYDSFSNNIIGLLEQELSVTVDLIRIDDSRFVLNDDEFCTFLNNYDAVVAGPGPGHPANATDVGLIGHLWTLPDHSNLPVFGICLGFQSLALAHGATASRLTKPRHGIVTGIDHSGYDIFEGLGSLNVTQYHSLHVKVDPCRRADQDQTSSNHNQLVPLAWDLSDTDNGPILMAVRHCHKPFFGVQFHPESICTNAETHKLVQNWWRHVCAWNKSKERRSSPFTRQINGDMSLGQKPRNGDDLHDFQDSGTNTLISIKIPVSTTLDVLDIVTVLRKQTANYEPILLGSGTREGVPVNAETGRYSIVGLHDAASTHLRYSSGSHTMQISTGPDVISSEHGNVADVFEFLEHFMRDYKVTSGPADVPFWGGLMGFVSYEAGLESIGVSPSLSSISSRPDAWFVLVERSIVVDHVTGDVHVQSIRPNDAQWLSYAVGLFSSLQPNGVLHEPTQLTSRHAARILSEPTKQEYCEKVAGCQSHLRAGSSYELCLTDQTTVQTAEAPWSLYKRLFQLNPAPFSACMVLEDASDSACSVSVVGSSPERFLSWSRAGLCQFRPIKGTVKKGAGVTRTQAEAILGSAKERAENLMIVDLIRHDLAGVTGVRDVRVPKLMSVEEYETVFQLVSVIEGDLSPARSGVSVLAASLPPGSMTGAPKRRSCELLQAMEQEQPRGLYSGVMGYLDVGGGGDFSVIIRTAFKWRDEDVWRIGAGGAVTTLSTEDGEYEEMMVKRERLMDLFFS